MTFCLEGVCFPLVAVIMAFAKERIRDYCLFFGADEILDVKEGTDM